MSLVLDINDNRIKVVVIKPKRNKYLIEKFLRVDLPKNMVENGYLMDSSFSIFIKKILNDNNIKEKRCYIVINSTEIVSKEITVPVISKNKLNLLVFNEIENYLGKAVDHIRDFSIIEKTSNNLKNDTEKNDKAKISVNRSNELYNIIVYSTPEKIVYSWFKAIEDVGLKPYKMDIEENCIAKVFYNSLINNVDIKDKSVISVYLENGRLVLNLILNSKNIFSRVIDYGEKTTNQYKGYGIQEDNLILNENNTEENIELYNNISKEILKLMQFSLSQKIRKSVSNIFLFGSLSAYKDIVQYLEENLSTKVEVIKTLSTLHIKAEVDTVDVVLSSGSVMGWNL